MLFKSRFAFLQWMFLVLAAAGYLWAKSFALHYVSSGDENTYYYMAKLMAGGKLFYRDFFFAHPPLQLLLLTAVYLCFGFNLVALKLTAFLPPLLGAAFLYRQFCRGKQPLAGGFFLLIFLFNYEFLKITSHPFGLNLTVFFLMLSLYYFIEKKPFPAGLMWGLASLTGFYALPWGLVPIGFYLLRGERRAGWFLFPAGFLLTFGAVNGFLLFLWGRRYLEPVFIYHLIKPRGRELVSDIYIQVARRNFSIFFLPFLYLWAKKDPLRNAVLAAGLLYLVFLASLNPLFTQYFMLPMPFLAWISAVSLASLLEGITVRSRRGWAAVISVLIILAVNADNIRRYIRHERGTGFVTVRGCVDFIEKNSAPGDLIFGHVTTAPLLALLTGRNIALDLVDTNFMRFRSGLTGLDQVLSELVQEKRLKFMITRENRLWLDPRVERFLHNRPPAAVFDEPRERILIFDCRPD